MMYCRKCRNWYEPTTGNLTGFCPNCIPKSWVSNTTTYVGENQPSIKPEQDALEKLGWTKSKIDAFHVEYTRFNQSLMLNTSWETISIENIVGIYYNDILALAKVIKEMENK